VQSRTQDGHEPINYSRAKARILKPSPLPRLVVAGLGYRGRCLATNGPRLRRRGRSAGSGSHSFQPARLTGLHPDPVMLRLNYGTRGASAALGDHRNTPIAATAVRDPARSSGTLATDGGG
jgi:hypothetical protein